LPPTPAITQIAAIHSTNRPAGYIFTVLHATCIPNTRTARCDLPLRASLLVQEKDFNTHSSIENGQSYNYAKAQGEALVVRTCKEMGMDCVVMNPGYTTITTINTTAIITITTTTTVCRTLHVSF
jgi:hypothetical protein